jgi:hypothetical protein
MQVKSQDLEAASVRFINPSVGKNHALVFVCLFETSYCILKAPLFMCLLFTRILKIFLSVGSIWNHGGLSRGSGNI